MDNHAPSSQLINLIGPIKKLSAISGSVSDERIITSKPRYGEKIKVETPTTLMGTLEFYNNAKIQFFCSWDVWKHNHSTIELYGLKGSMIIPDPNFFSGDILISSKNNTWEKINNDSIFLVLLPRTHGRFSYSPVCCVHALRIACPGVMPSINAATPC